MEVQRIHEWLERIGHGFGGVGVYDEDRASGLAHSLFHYNFCFCLLSNFLMRYRQTMKERRTISDSEQMRGGVNWYKTASLIASGSSFLDLITHLVSRACEDGIGLSFPIFQMNSL